ncbi:hypothetical protein G7034_10310, partial [Psychroflexus sp. C1]|nr:hypothetical protein [Psychroflexus maritimus]
ADNEIGEFDLTQKDEEINPNAGDPNTEVIYYESEEDFEAGIPIINPENFFTSESPQTIYAEVVNTDNECPSSTQVTFEITVNPLPLVDISNMDGSVICIDRETGEILSAPTLDTGLNANDYEFEWFLDGDELAFTGSALTVEEAGLY